MRRRDGQDGNWRIPAETLQGAVDLLDGVACFVDHASWFDLPSMRDLAAVTFDPVWDAKGESIDGGIRLYDRPDLDWLQALLDQIVEDQEAGREVPDVGLSLSFFGRHDWIDVGEDPGEPFDEAQDREFERVTVEITHVESCDIVFGPGADGRVREVLQRLSDQRPGDQRLGDQRPRVAADAPIRRRLKTMEPEEVLNEDEGRRTEDEQEAVSAAPVESSPASTPAPVAMPALEFGALAQQDFGELSRSVAAMGAQIDRLTGLLAEQLGEPQAVHGMGVAPRDRGAWSGERGALGVHRMLSTRDQIQLAYEQLMGLPVSEPVHRLSGIRELYLLLTGDREFRGQIDLDLVPQQLAYSNTGANADTTTMAELTRNVMNKVLVQQLDLLAEYNWWRQIARIENFNSLQQVSWVRYGGIGYSSGTGLPTVAEKGEYQQLYWEDERTTATWVKKGGYLPLSLEMIDRDDLAGWRDVPRQLAVAEAVTISSVVSALFTDNSGSGANLSDGVGDGYAFNTTRGNLITQPLDQTNWDTAVNTMYELAQLMNSSVSESRAIAARPKYCLVPIELESQAISAITSAVKPSTFGDRRPTRRILPEENVITVPHWTNADNWAALADPNLVPFVGVAFRFGEVPEIFMPSDANHVLWLHDVLPIKVRWFFAVSVIDTRGAIKSNMS